MPHSLIRISPMDQEQPSGEPKEFQRSSCYVALNLICMLIDDWVPARVPYAAAGSRMPRLSPISA